MARCAAGNKLYGLVPAQGAVCCLVSHRVGARTGLQLLRFADYPSEQRPGQSSVGLMQWMVFFSKEEMSYIIKPSSGHGFNMFFFSGG